MKKKSNEKKRNKLLLFHTNWISKHEIHDIHESINQTQAQKPEAEFKGGAHGPASSQNQRTDSTKPGVQTFDVATVGEKTFFASQITHTTSPTRFLRQASSFFHCFWCVNFKASVGNRGSVMKFHGCCAHYVAIRQHGK